MLNSFLSEVSPCSDFLDNVKKERVSTAQHMSISPSYYIRHRLGDTKSHVVCTLFTSQVVHKKTMTTAVSKPAPLGWKSFQSSAGLVTASWNIQHSPFVPRDAALEVS